MADKRKKKGSIGEKTEKCENIMFYVCVLCKDDVITLKNIFSINLPYKILS